jgi:signal peptidase I
MAPNPPPGGQRPPLVRSLRSWRFVVQDESLSPAIAPGDRILVDPNPRGAIVRGSLVVAQDPEVAPRRLLKRVVALPGDLVAWNSSEVRLLSEEANPRADDGFLPERMLRLDAAFFLVGDRRDRSRDSRHFGPISREAILGVAWYRTHPRERRGSLTPDPLQSRTPSVVNE